MIFLWTVKIEVIYFLTLNLKIELLILEKVNVICNL